MTLPPYTREGEFYRDADGYDVAQDERWEQVDPSGFHPDPSLEEWPRPRRSTLQKSPVCREDFDPAGLPELGVVPGAADCDVTPAVDAPVASGRRVQPF